RHPGAVEDARGRGDRAVEVVVGLVADECLRHDPGAWLEAERLRLLARHQQDRSRTVGDLRRRAGGVQAALEHGLQAGELLERGVTQTTVALDERRLAGRLAVLTDDRRLDRGDLRGETTLRPRLSRLLL